MSRSHCGKKRDPDPATKAACFCPWKQGGLFTHEVILILVETDAHSRKTAEIKRVARTGRTPPLYTQSQCWMAGEERGEREGA